MRSIFTYKCHPYLNNGNPPILHTQFMPHGLRDGYRYHTLFSSHSHLILFGVDRITVHRYVLSLRFVGVAYFDLPFTVFQLNSKVLILYCAWLWKPPPPITLYLLYSNMLRNLAAIKNMLAPTQALSRIVRSKVRAFKIITVYITSLGNSIDLLPTFIDSSTFQFNTL